MLMLNITQERLTDDWLIDRSLPSSLPYGNEEDVDCESKTLHNGSSASNPFARWFCSVTTPDNPHGDMGDVYVKETKHQASKVPDTIEGAEADAAEQLRRDEKHGLYGGKVDDAN